MKNVFDWYQTLDEQNKTKPWLILGKGPSYDKKSQFDVSRFNTMSLNHVVRDEPVFVAHMIDIDVAESCADCLLANATYLILPWVPHVKNVATAGKTLEAWRDELPILRELDAQGRLLFYNLSSSDKRGDDSPVVPVRYFSAEASLNILAMLGVNTVRTLGIDGGNQYSSNFSDLKTLLSNGRSAFDAQFSEIAKTIQAYQVDYAPLDCQSPVKVFVGSSPNEILPVKILEYSIKKHASLSVEVFPLFEAKLDYPMPKDLCNQPRTPFSFQRFLIPELCNYQGRAIYMDADMQVFQDIRSFWRMDFNGADVLTTYKAGDTERRPQFSVIMLNCESLRWQIKDIVQQLDNHKLDYAQLMYEFKLAKTIRADIPPSWNSLEYYKQDETALTHYTDMPSQPWISTQNKYTHVWMTDLFEALDSGFIYLDFVDEQIQLGNIRPSLRLQIDRKEPNPKKVPRRLMEALDKDFIAPYQALQYEKAASEQSPKKKSFLKKLFRPLVAH